MPNISFYINKSKSPIKSVYGKIFMDGKSKRVAVPVRIDTHDWDHKNNYPKDRTSSESRALDMIHRLITITLPEELEKKYKRPATIDEIHATYSKRYNNSTLGDNRDITFYVNDYICTRKNMLSSTAVSTMNSTFNLLMMFSETQDVSLSVSEIDRAWFAKFIDFMCYHEIPEKNKKRYRNSSTITHIRTIYAILNFYERKPPFKINDVIRGIRSQYKKEKGKVYITFEQVRELYELEIDDYKDRLSRDLFVFCCYTGFRFNEVMSLVERDIMEGDGYKYISHTTSKNYSEINVPLNETCLEIIDRYVNQWRMFPKISNGRANKTIKRIISNLSGMSKEFNKVSYSGRDRIEERKTLSELITFHSSRHSFACNMLDQGMSFQEVSDLMGVNVSTLMNWYANSKEEIRNSKAFEILNR